MTTALRSQVGHKSLLLGGRGGEDQHTGAGLSMHRLGFQPMLASASRTLVAKWATGASPQVTGLGQARRALLSNDRLAECCSPR